MKLLLQVHLVLWFLIATVCGRDFRRGTFIDWGSKRIGKVDVHIYSKAVWSIINNHASHFDGNIYVEAHAGLYVSSISPRCSLSATLSSLIYGFVNHGVVSFNAIKGASGYVFKIMGSKFENNGDLFFSASGLSSVTCGIKSKRWYNKGCIHVYQKWKSDSCTHLGYDGLTIVNNGQICFTNHNWKQLAGILGTGCVTAHGQSSFYFLKTNLKIAESQIFYLADGETSIMAVASRYRPQTFHVRGFGKINGVANKIGLSSRLYSRVPGRKPWSYDARRGILTLYTGLYSQRFEIGIGYDVTKFEIVTDRCRGLPGVHLGALQYNGPPPHPGMPPQCQPCKPIPSIPGEEKPPTSYTIDTATIEPSEEPSEEPVDPTTEPTDEPTVEPTDEPTVEPTVDQPTTSLTHGLILTVTVTSTSITTTTSTTTAMGTVTVRGWF